MSDFIQALRDWRFWIILVLLTAFFITLHERYGVPFWATALLAVPFGFALGLFGGTVTAIVQAGPFRLLRALCNTLTR